jgi:tetratricopeptide (TPR) repeat protein
MNATKQINKLLDEEQWTDARKLIRTELRKEPDNHWLLDQLSTSYYEQKKYGRALKIIKKALAAMPDCPLVLWDYAGTLDMLGRKGEAIDIYKKLIRTRVPGYAYDECWEGEEWAASLKADCKYRIGCCYMELGRRKTALRFFDAYQADLANGADSIYKDRPWASLSPNGAQGRKPLVTRRQQSCKPQRGRRN